MIWVLIAVLFAAGEVASLSFFLAPFAVGALLGAVADLAGLSTVAAVLIFLVSSGAAAALRAPDRAPAHVHGAADPHRHGGARRQDRGRHRSRSTTATGVVKLEGEMWTARTYVDGDVIEVGHKVHVVEIRGATALVSDTE